MNLDYTLVIKTSGGNRHSRGIPEHSFLANRKKRHFKAYIWSYGAIQSVLCKLEDVKDKFFHLYSIWLVWLN